MNIKELKQAIEKMEEVHGNMDEVKVLYRDGYDSDPVKIAACEEDRFKKHNSTLDTIVLVTCTKDA